MKRFALAAATAAIAITGAAHAFPGQAPGEANFQINIEEFNARTAPVDGAFPGQSQVAQNQDPDAGIAYEVERIGRFAVVEDYARFNLTAPQAGTVYGYDNGNIYVVSEATGDSVRLVGDARTLTK
ncbi:hypothetical protein [Mesobacterium pallidum]|uniref:hypothetical protein n=1 Tax=Mesobacterium pallidum TaxID=2872037 RepID=UPI001EE25833|nr:hypothetical protein [Mesobacterium pallidum]